MQLIKELYVELLSEAELYRVQDMGSPFHTYIVALIQVCHVLRIFHGILQ